MTGTFQNQIQEGNEEKMKTKQDKFWLKKPSIINHHSKNAHFITIMHSGLKWHVRSENYFGGYNAYK